MGRAPGLAPQNTHTLFMRAHIEGRAGRRYPRSGGLLLGRRRGGLSRRLAGLAGLLLADLDLARLHLGLLGHGDPQHAAVERDLHAIHLRALREHERAAEVTVRALVDEVAIVLALVLLLALAAHREPVAD